MCTHASTHIAEAPSYTIPALMLCKLGGFMCSGLVSRIKQLPCMVRGLKLLDLSQGSKHAPPYPLPNLLSVK